MAHSTNDDNLVDVCFKCIVFLNDRYSHEKTLFRTSPSLTDVRNLQKSLIEGVYGKLRDEFNPHVVAGVVVNVLKSMSTCLFSEIYEEIINLELTEDFNQSRNHIISALVNLNPIHLDLTRSLIGFLFRISSNSIDNDNNNNASQLSMVISPIICKPIRSASYMSIRHMEDLRKIRPIISFMIENFSEIFTKDLKAKSNKMNIIDKQFDLSSSTGLLNSLAVSSPTPHDNRFSGTSLSPKYPVSSISIPVTSNIGIPVITTEQTHILMDVGDNSKYLSSSTMNQNEPNSFDTSSSEWQILEILLKQSVDSFVCSKFTYTRKDRGDLKHLNSNSQISTSANGARSNVNSSSIRRQPSSDLGGHSRPGTPATNVLSSSYGQNPSRRAALNTGLEPREPGQRRKMIAECKALRSQISQFEKDFNRKHRREPKTSERGPMQTVYSKYRELKKTIRDIAATDIQRTVRGCFCRLKMEGDNVNVNGVDNISEGDNSYFLQHLQLKQNNNMSNQIWANPSNSSQLQYMMMSPPPAVLSDVPTEDMNGSIATGRTGLIFASPSPPPLNSDLISKFAAQGSGNSNDNNMALDDGSINVTIPNSSTSLSGIPNEMLEEYRDIQNQKKEIKKVLKRFDEDFTAANGRAPRKIDKEVMRPIYQNYHELKGRLDELKKTIELQFGSLPDELREDQKLSINVNNNNSNPMMMTQSTSSSSNSNSMDIHASDHGLALEATAMNITEGQRHFQHPGMQQSIPTWPQQQQQQKFHYEGSSSAAEEMMGSANTSNHQQQQQGFDQTQSSSSTGMSDADRELEILQEEKRNLHAYLKAYEKDFNKTHGRPVMKQEDIQPVAHEYQRYKELKRIMKDLKDNSKG